MLQWKKQIGREKRREIIRSLRMLFTPHENVSHTNSIHFTIRYLRNFGIKSHHIACSWNIFIHKLTHNSTTFSSTTYIQPFTIRCHEFEWRWEIVICTTRNTCARRNEFGTRDQRAWNTLANLELFLYIIRTRRRNIFVLRAEIASECA